MLSQATDVLLLILHKTALAEGRLLPEQSEGPEEPGVEVEEKGEDPGQPESPLKGRSLSAAVDT